MCILSSLAVVGSALGAAFSAMASGLATAGAAVGSAVGSVGATIGSTAVSLATGTASLGTYAAVGGGLGLLGGAISTTTSLIGAYGQNKAVEDQYQQEVDMARQKAAYDQQRQNEETHERLLQNAQEARESSLESMQIRANAEAAMSALNIAGNSGQREVGVADIAQIRREGAYAENEDVIGVQHLMSQIGINKQYEWDTMAARNRAKSNWQDVQGMGLKGFLYDTPMAGLQGAISGASIGSSLFGGASSAGASKLSGAVATPATNKIGGSSSYLSGGAFGMALA